jgi:large subunit ribosomal protein L13
MTTFSAKEEDIEKNWLVVDVSGRRVGRVASQIATLLRGKHKPTYTPHIDSGDFVIALNTEELEFSGEKAQDKMYAEHSGWPGGLKEMSAEERLESDPEGVLKAAVKGMLPKNNLGQKMLDKLKIYRGSEHPHEAQQPESITLE